jgi:antitoxin component of MazEF toxin-antitoxin module
MRRKLIQHGLSSLTLSLPRKWVKEHNLSKGDEVEVESSPKKLVISAKAGYARRRIELDVTGAGIMTKRITGAAFKAGYDEIYVSFSSHEELRIVTDLVRAQFSGFGILSQTKNTLTIKNMSATNFDEFDNVLRRFFLMLNDLSQGVGEAASADDFEWLKNLALQKYDSDKFTDYCRRAINMGHEPEKNRAAPLYTIIEQLEKAVDRYAELCNHLSSNRLKTAPGLKSALKDIASFERRFYELFYRFSFAGIAEFGKTKQLLQKRLDDLSLAIPKSQLKTLELCNRILNLIFDLNGPLMAARI